MTREGRDSEITVRVSGLSKEKAAGALRQNEACPGSEQADAAESSVFFVYVPESDAAMSAPSVRVYTEQRNHGAGESREERARRGRRG